MNIASVKWNELAASFERRSKAGALAYNHTDALKGLTGKGLFVVFALLAAAGVWATTAEISGAVVSSGQLVAQNNVRKVQHPNGGVVHAIYVRDGERVEANQVVVRLDDIVARAALAGVTKRIDELDARAARLNAERTDFSALAFPASLTRRLELPEVKEIVDTERALYDVHKVSHVTRKQRMAERIEQLRNEVSSLKADLSAKQKLTTLTDAELNLLRDLAAKELTTSQRLNAVQRESINLAGQLGQISAGIAQAHGKIIETEMQLTGLDDELRAETIKELREVQAERAQQQEKYAAALDQLQRVEIRSPIAGRVHQLAIHAVGGVIQPAEQIMLIVPSEEKLELEVRLSPQDIDQVFIGQTADVQFNAFNRRTTPKVEATVTQISADVTTDQRSGAAAYIARIALSDDSLARLEGVKLQPGMQAEALIKTSERTPLQYLVKPLLEQMSKALRER